MKTLGQIVRRNRFVHYTNLEKIECSDIMNLYKDESGNINVIPNFSTFSRLNTSNVEVYVHVVDEVPILVYYDYDNQNISYSSNESSDIIGGEQIISNNIDIRSFGRMLLITDKQNLRRYYSIYENGGYTNIKEFVYPIANFKLTGENFEPFDESDSLGTIYSYSSTEWNDQYGYAGWITGQVNKVHPNTLYTYSQIRNHHYGCWMVFIEANNTPPSSSALWKYKEEYNSWFYNTYFKDRQKGFFSGFALVRIGFRMYDGSVAFVSTPKLIATGAINSQYYAPTFHAKWHTTNDNQGGVYRYTTRSYAIGQIKVDITLDTWTIDTKLIKGLCVFMSKPLDAYNLEYKIDADSGSGEYSTTIVFHNQLNRTGVLNEYVESVSYYLVKEFAINANSYSFWIDSDLTTLELNERLETGYNNMTQYIGMVQFNYNGRLYDGNVQLKPFSKQTSYNILSEGSNAITSVSVLNYNNNMYYVKGDTINYNTSLKIAGMVTYPDIRCSKIYVLTNDLQNKLFTITLQEHSLDSYSYYIFVSDLINTQYGRIKEEATYSFLTKSVSSTSNTDNYALSVTIKDSNLLTISEVNNPFTYNQNNLINVGNSTILGIGSQSAPTSQGQFGQFPIVVITADGVYLLNISSDVKFAISHVVNILNRKTKRISNLVNVGNVLFYADDYNINMVNGGMVEDFTKGVLRLDIPEPVPAITNSPNFKHISKNLYNDTTIVRDDLSYKLSYSSLLNGLIFDNILIQFNGFISTLDDTIQRAFNVNGYNLCIFSKSNNLYDLSTMGNSTTGKQAYFITNPITNFDYLKLERITLHANTNENVHNILGVYASDDNIKYYPVMTVSSKARNIGTGLLCHSAKYWVIFYMGMVWNNFSLDVLESDIQPTILK